MGLYAFAAVVDGLDLDDDSQLDRLFTDDFIIVPAVNDGLATLTVEIEASSDLAAIGQLHQHLLLHVPEVTIERLDEDFVTVSEIGLRVGRDRETARLWSAGTGFPLHHTVLHGGKKMWTWCAVHAWIIENRPRQLAAGDPVPLADAVVASYNGQLASRAAQPQRPVHFDAHDSWWGAMHRNVVVVHEALAKPIWAAHRDMSSAAIVSGLFAADLFDALPPATPASDLGPGFRLVPPGQHRDANA